ncbi:hypothetical protein F5Y17DRAFT_441562 [Xylariaceae sp. FL0594]|nr:hypothetical protein F5Y17DRAFT_441562 [Xylariaceae sp. FL0594]
MQFFIAASLFAAIGSSAAVHSRADPTTSSSLSQMCHTNSTLIADGHNQGPFLIAACKDSANAYVTSILRLNYCVGNQGGNLVGQDSGGYGSSCWEQKIDDDGVTLKATCLIKDNLNNPSASVNLSTVVNAGPDGKLTCFGHTADAILG